MFRFMVLTGVVRFTRFIMLALMVFSSGTAVPDVMTGSVTVSICWRARVVVVGMARLVSWYYETLGGAGEWLAVAASLCSDSYVGKVLFYLYDV